MASTKTVKQYFDDFIGKDRRENNLTRPLNSFLEMKNLEYSDNLKGLVGRKGCKLAAQPLYVRKLHKYIYHDDDGEQQEELLCIGALNFGTSLDDEFKIGTLFRLKKDTFNITRDAGSTSWYYYFDTSSTNWRFIIEQDSSTVMTSLCGDGYQYSDKSLKTLCDEIDGLTNFSCSCPKTAVVNGNQTGVGTGGTATITVDTGHTVSVGDILEVLDQNTGNLLHAECIATAATTITLDTPTTIDVNDDDVIGCGRMPAAALIEMRTDSTWPDIDTPKPVAYSYWEMVPYDWINSGSDNKGAFHVLNTAPGDQDRGEPVFENHRECCYITAPFVEQHTHYQLIPEGDVDRGSLINVKAELPVSGFIPLKYYTGVYKYDGVSFYKSGLPLMNDTTQALAVAGAGSGTGLAAGTYKYTYSYLYTDAKGNEVELFAEEVQEVTLSSAEDVTVTLNQLGTDQSAIHHNIEAVTTSTSGTGTTKTVAQYHTFRTDEYVYIKDSGSGRDYRVRITDWTETTIDIDTSMATSGSEMVSRVVLRLWRTQANGNEFFLNDVLYPTMGSSTFTYTDQVADASLGFSQDAVRPIEIHTGLPRGRALATHQSVLAVGGGPENKQTVTWEDADSSELTAPSTFNERLPSFSNGDIQAMFSDDDNSLAIFKKNAHFSLKGNMPAAATEVHKINDAGKGVAGQHAAVLVDKAIVGISPTSFLWNEGGFYDTKFGESQSPLLLNPRMRPVDQIQFSRIQVAYDEEYHRIHFFLPCENVDYTASPAEYWAHDESLYLVYDVKNEMWYDFEYAEERLPTGGFAELNKELYWGTWGHQDTNSEWLGFLHKRHRTGLDKDLTTPSSDPAITDANFYRDGTASYTWEIETQWDDAGDPEKLKSWHEFALYMLDEKMHVGSFSVTFSSQRDWEDDGTETDTSRTMTFSSSTTREARIQFDPGHRAKRRNIKLSGTISKNPPVISGFQYTVDDKSYDSGKFGRAS